MTLVDADDMSAYFNGVVWTPTQELHINDVVLPGIQQQLETYLNRPVEPMHVRESRQPDCDGRFWPTVTPVWRVLAIDYAPVGGSVYNPAPYAPVVPLTPVLETVREWDPAGTKMGDPNWAATPGSSYIFIPGWIWTPDQPLTGGYAVVEYVGGYNGYVDSALKLAIQRVAAREIERIFDNATTLRDGAGVATAPSDPRLKGWTAEELAAFDRHRRRVVVS